MCLEFLDVGITCCDQRRPHSIIARNNFCFVWLVVYVVAVSSSIVRAEPIAFVKGDAVFPAIILDNSRFLNGMPIVDAPQFGAWPDFGVMLDLSNVPDTQVEHARSLARDLIKRDGQGAVMLFVVDSEFDVANNWLGIPYSKNRFRIPEGSVNVNGFGPNGSASLSLRETFGVPALRVREKHSGSYITEDGVQLVLVSIKETYFQKNRNVVAADGSVQQMLFEYKPTRRVGFEDGDAFFVANAAPLFAGISEDVELEYLVLPRQSYSVSNPNGGNFPEENLDDVDSKLPVEPKGLKLTVRNVPLMQQKQLSKFIPPKTTQHEWFVFLMDQDYEVDKYGLGYRYNDKPFERAIKRPFEFELIDCLFMEDRFPKGDAHKPWPKPLRVNWNAEHANVRFSDVKLVFVLWYEGVYFYSKPEHDFYQMVNNELQKWSNAKKVDTQIFK